VFGHGVAKRVPAGQERVISLTMLYNHDDQQLTTATIQRASRLKFSNMTVNAPSRIESNRPLLY
jgi:hypothetical protein